MRKVKHLTVNLAVNGSYDVFWALVFVPEGYNPNALSQLVLSMAIPCTNPNQYVMNCGICDPEQVQPGSALVSPAISIAVIVFTLLSDVIPQCPCSRCL